MASSSYSPYTGPAKPYSPSAPPAPDPDSNPNPNPNPNPDQPWIAYPYQPPITTVSSAYAPIAHAQTTTVTSPYAPIAHATSFSSGSNFTHGYGYQPYQQQQQNAYPSFPPGTHPDVIRRFQMVDRNQNGYIEESELREALTWNYGKFGLGTVRLLIYLFRSPYESSARIGPKEFLEIWSCLGQWRAIFERFDRDRSGKIDAVELRDALYSLGYALPPAVLQVLISRYDDDSGRRVELSFDSFVECGMIVKGLTEKFKEKDTRYTGSATLSYDAFMSMIIPFIVSD